MAFLRLGDWPIETPWQPTPSRHRKHTNGGAGRPVPPLARLLMLLTSQLRTDVTLSTRNAEYCEISVAVVNVRHATGIEL
jgi:hypothetical protein